jgi:hypothetical protein
MGNAIGSQYPLGLRSLSNRICGGKKILKELSKDGNEEMG